MTNLIVSPSNIFQSRLEKVGNVGLVTYTLGIKGRHKKQSGCLAKELCLGPTSVINCTPLSIPLSEFVSSGAWLQQATWEAPLKKQLERIFSLRAD